MGGEEWKWFPIILQGGSFAVLVIICLWLLYWVPKWRTEANARSDAARASQEAIALAHKQALEISETAHDARLEKLLAAFVADQRYEREQCTTLFRTLEEGQRQHRAGLEQIIRALPPRPGRRDQT